MEPPVWQVEFGDGPLVACAIHEGGYVRPEVERLMRLDRSQRRYEEDPYTGRWTAIAPTRIVVRRSRFEVDLNRPREKCVYLTPDDAWGLNVWKSRPPQDVVETSLAAYDDFYAHLGLLVDRLLAVHGRVVVFDLHSYNHRRSGPDGPPAAEQDNPQINLGTQSMRREAWTSVVERFIAEMRSSPDGGPPPDVRENVKFFGGNMVRWLHGRYGESVCAMAVEVKKTFMDEWTGELVVNRFDEMSAALARAAAGVVDELEKA